MAHHGSEPSPEIRELFRNAFLEVDHSKVLGDLNRAIQNEEWKLGATHRFPEGKLTPDDEGADVPWPVEGRFLNACIADSPVERMWGGPYPLIDVASVRVAHGLDPLATEERRSDELPVHNPLADARQSARLFREALAATLPSASSDLLSADVGTETP